MKSKLCITVWGVLLLGVVILGGTSGSMSPETRSFLFNEGSIIEALSAISYFVAAGLLLLQIGLRMPARWSALWIVLCFGMRELDFDKRFTSMGLLKSRIYSASDVPVYEKLLAALLMASLVAALFFLIKNYFVPFIKGVLRGDGMALSMFFCGGALFVSKSLDGIARKLKPFGVETTDGVKQFAECLEESLELAAAFLLLFVVLLAFRQGRPKREILKV